MDDDTITNDNQQTSDDDSENTKTRYARSLYNDDEHKDYINKNELNPISADLDDGLEDDAFIDTDDATLTAENDSDVTQTGMDDVDADNISPLKEKIGDTVIDDDFSE